MTFESFDAAPLIETGAFVPAMAALVEAGPPDAATLDAALREAARAEMRAEASILDLWVERPGASNFRLLEGPAFTAGTSRHAWAIMAGDDGALILSPGDAKDPNLRAAFGDDDWDESGGVVVVGPNLDEGDDDGSYTGGNYGDGSYPGGPDSPGIGDGAGGDQLDSDSVAERVTIDDSVPPEERARAELAEAKLEAEMREFEAKINSLADDAIVTIGDKTMTGAELKAAFADLRFVITYGVDYGPGAMGKNEDGVVSINLDSLEYCLNTNYSWGSWGTNWLFLHELIHLTQLGQNFYNDQWNLYLATDNTPTTREFRGTTFFTATEQFINDLSGGVGGVIDAPVGPNPPGGFSG